MHDQQGRTLPESLVVDENTVRIHKAILERIHGLSLRQGAEQQRSREQFHETTIPCGPVGVAIHRSRQAYYEPEEDRDAGSLADWGVLDVRRSLGTVRTR